MVLGVWLLSQQLPSAIDGSLMAACAGLLLVSWLDDSFGLSPVTRLLAQVLAVSLCVAQLAPDLRAIPSIPLLLERFVEGLAWIWFINLFNFMDGIDGLAGTEAVSLSIGYVAVATLAGVTGPYTYLAMLIAAAMVGYLPWNWHPARVLMGDAGSIPLGFLTGWLMLDLAVHGLLAAAIILPIYFVADATATLVLRLWRGRAPHQSHREHFYQRATLARGSHQPVVLRVVALDLLLLALSLLSSFRPMLALALAVLSVLFFLVHLKRLARSRA
jgi:UDP-N-acetylmuramyl pentapeptide phosphotransferase/UDP-N-acetylglucosamine-1-phosphate transferase